MVGPSAAGDAEQRLKQVLWAGLAEAKRQEARKTPMPTSALNDDEASSSNNNGGPPPARRRALPQSQGGCGRKRLPLPCRPLTRDRLGPVLKRFFERQRNIPAELHAEMGAPNVQKTTLRVVLDPHGVGSPCFAGSMWEKIRPRDPNGLETAVEAAARLDPLYRDFFRAVVGRFINEYVYGQLDWEDFNYADYEDEHGDIPKAAEEQARAAFVKRIPFRDDDDPNASLNLVLANAMTEMQDRRDWEMAFRWASDAFRIGQSGNAPRPFPTPAIDVYNVFQSPGCPHVLLVDITVAVDDVQFAMTHPVMLGNLYGHLKRSAAQPELPRPGTPDIDPYHAHYFL